EKISRTGRLFGRPAYYDLEEKLPGFLEIDANRFNGRLYERTFWSLAGYFEEKLSDDRMLLPGLTYKFKNPQDFEGPFEATFGGGEAKLEWRKSGASITGGSPIGDKTVKGKAHLFINL
ncbi:hypothetical protein DFQ27_003043, partial [Actinomortierella ambigua]